MEYSSETDRAGNPNHGVIFSVPALLGLIYPLCLPLFLNLAADSCGRRGILVGRFLSGLYFFSWLLLAIYFGVKAATHFQRSQLLAILNSAAMILCVGGFVWSYHADPFLDAFQAGLRQAYNVPEIQTWASGILNDVKENRILKQADYPSWAIDGRFPRPDGIYIINEQKSDQEGCVKISWGSGAAGQWGLMVGSPTLPKRGRMWSPGVYFYVNPRPYGWRD